jgi:hypothetical protein
VGLWVQSRLESVSAYHHKIRFHHQSGLVHPELVLAYPALEAQTKD